MNTLSLNETQYVSGADLSHAITVAPIALIFGGGATGLATMISPLVGYQHYKEGHDFFDSVKAAAYHCTLGAQLCWSIVNAAYNDGELNL